MGQMFQGSPSANPDVSKWDTSSVTNMNYMFDGISVSLDPSKWDTSKVTDMSFMFSSATTDADLSDWNTSNVTTMEGMFIAATFTGNIAGWDTSKVTNMNQMFYLSSTDPDMSEWDFSSAASMISMLTGSQISTRHYTDFLIRIFQTRTVNGVTLNATSQYYDSAATARASLVSSHSWIVSDNGSAGPDPG